MGVTTNARLYDKDGNAVDGTHPVDTKLSAGLSIDLGTTTDSAVIDPTDAASVIALLKGVLSVALSDEYDSIDVAKMTKGGVTVTHDAVGPAITTGATTLGSPIITGLTSHKFKIGDVAYVSIGFASTTQTVAAIAATTITVGNNATSTESNVSVSPIISYSSEINCQGFNSISVECAVSAITAGNWVLSILGCAASGLTFGACYSPKDDGTFVAQATPTLAANANTTYYFRGIPNYVKISATRTTDGTLTCKCTPMNL